MPRRRATPRVVCDSPRALEALSRLGVADALVPNATERLRHHPLAMPERLCKAGAQGLPNEHGAHQLPETRLMVMTSLAVGGLDRSQWFAANRRVVPSLLAFEAVDGNDPAKPLARLNALGVPFGRLCDRYASWGMLACTVTHIAAFERQVAEGVPLMVVLEDDVALGSDFPDHIGRLAAMHLLGNGSLLRRKARRRLPADLVQLGPCTEGYIVSLRAGIREPLTPSLTWLEPLTLTLTLSHTVTRSLPLTLTLRAATRLLEAYRRHGLRGCADQQLNDPRWQELAGVRAVRATQRVPWVSLAPTNFGDISRTPCISRSDHQLLRWLGRGGMRPHGLRVNATALALAPAQRKRGYCRSFDNVTRSNPSRGRHRYKPARDYLYLAPQVHGKVGLSG
jgi:GR25 family glycosyltransferase involved in LPS biosynthesis